MTDTDERDKLNQAAVRRGDLCSPYAARYLADRVDELKAECDAAVARELAWAEKYAGAELNGLAVTDERNGLRAQLTAMTARFHEASKHDPLVILKTAAAEAQRWANETPAGKLPDEPVVNMTRGMTRAEILAAIDAELAKRGARTTKLDDAVPALPKGKGT